ncbi:MAG TPA: agenet domain-containing protein [Pirellulales bacterium]|nr:agenet domain-containing protein [Pirellulales bacterium]
MALSSRGLSITGAVRSAFRTKRVAIGLLWAAVAFAAHRAPAQQDWRPEKTWLFAVGVLEWKDGKDWPAMESAKKDRRDVQLVEHFKAQGVPESRVAYLQDRHATLRRINTALEDMLSKTAPGDTLILYYTGHGFRDRAKRRVYFANYDATRGRDAWPVDEMFDTIERRFRGQQALLLADCCFSGALADEALRRRSPIAFGCLCSSFSHNTSTGNWTFTDLLLGGLRGSPLADENGDRVIEWEELGRWSMREMAFIERQKAVFATGNQFDPRFKLAPARGTRTGRSGEHVEVQWQNKWYRAQVLGSRGEELKVHYVGYADSWDEWVPPERVRPFRPPGFKPGSPVSVKWEGQWYPATVRRAWYGLHLVHYDNYSNEWNEWVGPDAIKERSPSKQPAHGHEPE